MFIKYVGEKKFEINISTRSLKNSSDGLNFRLLMTELGCVYTKDERGSKNVK